MFCSNPFSSCFWARARTQYRPVTLAAVFFGLLSTLVSAPVGGSDWPEFRGANRDGVAAESGLLRTWPQEGPRELWRVPVGEGFSGIAVVGDRLYTLFADDGTEYAAAFDVADGREIWRQRLDERFADVWGNGPRATPTVVDGVVYAVSALGQLVALRASTGQELWRYDFDQLGSIVDPFTIAGAVPPGEEPITGAFGHSSSPIVVGDLLVTFPGAQPEAAMAIFDRHTGVLLWSGLNHGSGHSSPVVVTIGGRLQVVQILANEILGLDPMTREVLWRHPWALVTVSQPVFVPPDMIFTGTVNDVGGELFQIVPVADDPSTPFTTVSKWKVPMMRSSWSSATFYKGHLFGFDNATLRCLDAESGKLQWARRGYGKGTVTVADGLLFVFTDHGEVHLGEASADGFVPKGSLKVFEQGPTWTLPSIADGRMYLRNHAEMVALELRNPRPAALASDASGASR